jgi:hypothetical protein
MAAGAFAAPKRGGRRDVRVVRLRQLRARGRASLRGRCVHFFQNRCALGFLHLEKNIQEKTIRISGKIKIDTYRAGFVSAIEPLLRERKRLYPLSKTIAWSGTFDQLDKKIAETKSAYFIRTAVECPNLIMDSQNYGLDLIIQRLVGINTYSLNILWGEIGTGSTTPALSDMALTTPTNRAAVGFQQDYGSTDAVLQFFYSDSQLANETYKEFGTFVDGTTTIGSGQIFNHALLSPTYAKVPGQDTTVQVDINISNA